MTLKISCRMLIFMSQRKALNEWVKKDDKSPHLDTVFGKHQKPDPYTAAAQMSVDTGHYEKKELPSDHKTDHSLMQTQVEFKCHNTDPFIDPEPNEPESIENRIKNENGSEAAKLVRGQIASYAGLTLALSFRLHLFTVLVFDKYYRLIRWDRRGATVTRKIDYTKDPESLFYFYHRFAQLDRLQRGFDPTVENIDQESTEVVAAKKCFEEYDEEVYHCDTTVIGGREETKFNPLFLKMTMPIGDKKSRSFIIPSPCFGFGCLSPFSRSTPRLRIRHSAAKAHVHEGLLA